MLDQEQARQAVIAVFAAWADAVEARNAIGIAALLAGDAVLLVPRGEPIRGRHAAQQLYETLFAECALVQRFELTGLDVTADRAFAWGSDAIDVIDPATGNVRDRARGHGLTVLRLEDDGCWRVTHAINNKARVSERLD